MKRKKKKNNRKFDWNVWLAAMIFMAAIWLAAIKTGGWQWIGGSGDSLHECMSFISSCLTGATMLALCLMFRFGASPNKNFNDIQYQPFSWKQLLISVLVTPIVYFASCLIGYALYLAWGLGVGFVGLVIGVVVTIVSAPFS